MTDGPDVRRAAVAFTADCGNFIAISGRYLVTSGGRKLCPIHGLPWCTSAAERRDLLGRGAPDDGQMHD